MSHVIVPKLRSAEVKLDGDRVVLIIDNQSISLPWQGAIQIATQMFIAAKKAEIIAKAENIAQDQALLMRIGANVGISSDPKILDHAKTLAAHDKQLRRLPSIDSRSVVGAPSLHVEKKEDR